MSAEDPIVEPPPQPEPDPAPAPPPAPVAQPAAAAPPPPAAPASGKATQRALIVATIVVALMVAGFFIARSGLLRMGGNEPAYSVEPYTPREHLMSGRERVLAHAEPDEASPVVVMFGAGASLDVTGRVSRGLGNDWFQIRWNNQTAYVRQQDAVAGEGTPPTIAERPRPEPEEKPAEPEEPEEPDVAEFPPSAPAGGLDLSDVRWVRAPSARDFARYYPRRALDEGQSGRVVLDCVASGSGALDCSVAEENPIGWGFGAAARRIAGQARIEPTTPDGRSVEGSHVRLPLAFRAD